MKDILVSLDTTDLCELRIDAAVTLAEKYDSHVTGLYTQRSINPALFGEGYAEAVIGAIADQIEIETAAVTRLFNDRLKTRYAKSDLKIEKLLTDSTVRSHANLADLIVTGQLDPDTRVYGEMHQPEHIVMTGGRPVLMVPYSGFPKTMGDHVMIGWNNSREATRAVHDALPILQKAKSVHVYTATDRFTGEREIVAADLAEHLARHDIKVETKPVIRGSLSVADSMLATAAELGIDMIVMGAYGHSRLREYTFGGTTRSMFEKMTLPTLMSH